MAESSISELLRPASSPTDRSLERRLSARVDPAWRRHLGDELRRRRIQHALTQAQLGDPLTKAYVSAVEHGRAIPSLPALRLMVERLDTSLGDFLNAVDERSTPT